MSVHLRGMWRQGGAKALGPRRPEHGLVSPCHVQAWLDVLCKLLRLPREQTDSIRVELEEHLRERVRDLMVEGEPEDAASRRAISELGDAAALADRFRRAEHAPRRRMLMNIAMLGMAGAAVVAGAVGVNRLANPPGAGTQSPPQVRYASADVSEKTITLPADATMERFVQELGRVAGKGTHVYWEMIEAQGLARNTPIGVPMANVTVETALMLANERVIGSPEKIACRMTGDLLEVSTLHHFDKRDMTLVAYDLGAALVTMAPARDKADVSEQLQHLITGVIDPEQWRENGGDLAELYTVGSKLFVKAPARFQPTVQWILAQLGSGKPAAASADENKVPVLGDIPLIAPLFRKDGERPSAPAADAGGATTFTATGDRVTATRGGKSITADSIDVVPGEGTIVARGSGGVTRREVSSAAQAASDRQGTVSITGQVQRPGAYSLPLTGLSLRRAIIAASGKLEGVQEVVVSKSENGLVTVVHRIKGEELRTEGGSDPMLADGQVIEVK